MSKLYIPTSTLNFNNIFSSESISPLFFYKEKKYGYKRFEKVEPNSLNKSILIYNKIPEFNIDNSDIDSYPLIIEISEELLDRKYISSSYEENNICIIQYKNTIYLHPNEVKILFMSNNDKRICLIKSEPSIETKLLPFYLSRIEIIEGNNSFKWNKKIISKIYDDDDPEIFNYINNDLMTDKLKGFYYSYNIGVINSIRQNNKYIANIHKVKKSIADNIEIIKNDFNLLNNLCNYTEYSISDFTSYCNSILAEIDKDSTNSVPVEGSLKNNNLVINFSNYKITQFNDVVFMKKGAEIYQSIVNDLLSYPIYDDISFLENRLDLTMKIGGILKEYIKNWEDSPIRIYLNALLDNIENYKEFDLNTHLKDDSSKYILQSIAVFIMNGNNPQKLLDKLNKYNLDPRLSFGLYGVTFGFASIPKTITNVLFIDDKENSNILIYKEAQEKLHNVSTNKDITIKQFEHNTEFVKVDTIKPNKSTIESEKNILTCPLCGKGMTKRMNSKNSTEFFGCTGYPDCRHTEKIHKEVKNISLINHIFNFVTNSDNCESKISDIQDDLKNTKIGKYTVTELKEIISNDARFDIIKIGRSNAVKLC